MPLTNASEFLQQYRTFFSNPVVADWKWEGEDDLFGKVHEWKLNRSEDIDAVATVDLAENALQLTITERPVGLDTRIVFDGMILLDEQVVRTDSVQCALSDAAIRDLIKDFNERT